MLIRNLPSPQHPVARLEHLQSVASDKCLQDIGLVKYITKDASAQGVAKEDNQQRKLKHKRNGAKGRVEGGSRIDSELAISETR